MVTFAAVLKFCLFLVSRWFKSYFCNSGIFRFLNWTAIWNYVDSFFKRKSFKPTETSRLTHRLENKICNVVRSYMILCSRFSVVPPALAGFNPALYHRVHGRHVSLNRTLRNIRPIPSFPSCSSSWGRFNIRPIPSS